MNCISQFLRQCGETLFPPECLACGAAMAGGQEFPLCSNCFPNPHLLKRSMPDVCLRCGTSQGRGTGHLPRCLQCDRVRQAWKRTAAVLSYSTPGWGNVIRGAKYGPSLSLASLAGEVLAERWEGLYGNREFHGIVAVPLHRQRLAERGFNQAEILAQVLSARIGVPLLGALVRVKNTPPLAGMSREERSRSMRGAFSVVRGVEIANKRLIVVDDILTTGATLHEAARTLVQSGAKSVWAAVLARAEIGEEASGLPRMRVVK